MRSEESLIADQMCAGAAAAAVACGASLSGGIRKCIDIWICGQI